MSSRLATSAPIVSERSNLAGQADVRLSSSGRGYFYFAYYFYAYYFARELLRVAEGTQRRED